MLGNSIVSMVTLGPIQALLNSVKQLQIIVHTMLINVSYPASTTSYFAILMQILTLQVIDLSDIYNRALKLDENSEENQPANFQFDLMGYSSQLIIQNFGTLCVSIFITPIAWITLLLLSKIFKRSSILAGWKQKFYYLMFYDSWITFFCETFLFLGVCSGLNVKYLHWESYGVAINSVLAIILGSLLIVFPLAAFVFY